MLTRLTATLGAGVLGAIMFGGAAMAQDTGADLMSLDKGALRGAIQSRYDEALALTQDPAIVSGDNDRFTWASQAKAQCGIALGFLKSGTRDPVSIGAAVNPSSSRMPRRRKAARLTSANRVSSGGSRSKMSRSG